MILKYVSCPYFAGESNRRSSDLPDAENAAAAASDAVEERTAADVAAGEAAESSKLTNSDARGLSR